MFLPLLSVALAGATAQIERGQYYWTFPETDCMPGDELGTCGEPGNATQVAVCKAACYANPNCGGFNIPNGHMKKLGCMDEMTPWADDPAKKDPRDPGHHALTLYTLSLYPPRREYWWELRGFDCNPDHELGSCKTTGLSLRGQQDHCKKVCQANIFCEGFNLPNGHLKAAGCKDDIIPDPKENNGTMTLYYRRGHPQVRDPKRTYLRHVSKIDCNPGQEIGNCSQYLPPPYTESECASACRANPLCGGFNLPNGHLKTVDCVQEFNTSHTQDLYYLAYPPAPPGPPLKHCQAALAKSCGAVEHKGTECLDCVMAHGSTLEPAGCTSEDETKFCAGAPPAPPTPPSAAECDKQMAAFCGSLKHNKTPCLACMDKHEPTLEKAGCTITNVDAFCEPV